MKECKYPNWTRDQIVSLLNIVGQNIGQRLLSHDLAIEFNSFWQGETIQDQPVNLDYWTYGRFEALLNIIGEENAKKMLANETSFTFKDNRTELFDKNGRRIPKKLEFHVCDPNLSVKLGDLFLNCAGDYQNCIKEFNRPLGGDLKITGAEFKAETERLIALISNDKKISNLLKGAWVPVILPQSTGNLKDNLDRYFRAAKFLYTRHCANNRVYYDGKSCFCGEAYVSPSSRYNELIAKTRERPYVGIYFLTALQGYSVLASREQMDSLPDGFTLSGFEPLIAAAMYPRIISQQNIFLELSAFSWVLDSKTSAYTQSSFRTKDAGLSFGPNLSLNRGEGNYSGGLLFGIGSGS